MIEISKHIHIEVLRFIYGPQYSTCIILKPLKLLEYIMSTLPVMPSIVEVGHLFEG